MLCFQACILKIFEVSQGTSEWERKIEYMHTLIHSESMNVCTLDNETIAFMQKVQCDTEKQPWEMEKTRPRLTLFRLWQNISRSQQKVSERERGVCVCVCAKVAQSQHKHHSNTLAHTECGESPMIAVVATCNKLKQADPWVRNALAAE